jgi:hypothetical protein
MVVRSSGKRFLKRRRGIMKTYLQILIVALTVLFFTDFASAQMVGSDHAWGIKDKNKRPGTKKAGFVDNLIFDRMSRKGKPNSVVFEPNDEPLWAKATHNLGLKNTSKNLSLGTCRNSDLTNPPFCRDTRRKPIKSR